MNFLLSRAMISVALMSASVSNSMATTITIVNNNAAGVGFNDPTPVAAVTGNTGVTLGQQRLNVFQAAADLLEGKLDSNVEILVKATMEPLPCSTFSAVLGSAGVNATIHGNFANAPVADTWFPPALANSLANVDLNPADEDIAARFNSDIGQPNCLTGITWSNIIGAPVPANTIDLFSTVVHEIAHGLGFATFANKATGALIQNTPDHFMRFLSDQTSGKAWPEMTNAERVASAINTGELIWTGPKAVEESTFLTAGLDTINPRMFAPSTLQGGSSVSHWDSALTPNEVMEPSATIVNEDWLTFKAFYDMGWQGNPCLKTTLPDDEWVMISLDCVPPTGENTVTDLFADDILGIYGTDWIVFGFDATTNTYVDPGINGILEVGKGYWIIQISGGNVTLDIPRDSHRTPVTAAASCATTSTSGCFQIPLTTKTGVSQFSMVGNTFRETVNFDDLRVVTNNGVCAMGCTLAAAQTANIVHNIFFTFNETSASYIPITSGDTISGRTGIWVATLNQADGLSPVLQIPYK